MGQYRPGYENTPQILSFALGFTSGVPIGFSTHAVPVWIVVVVLVISSIVISFELWAGYSAFGRKIAPLVIGNWKWLAFGLFIPIVVINLVVGALAFG